MNEQTVNLGVVEDRVLAALGEDATDVYCWRLEQLLRVGYTRVVADVIAADLNIDLHVACDLLANGCTEGTAYKILR